MNGHHITNNNGATTVDFQTSTEDHESVTILLFLKQEFSAAFYRCDNPVCHDKILANSQKANIRGACSQHANIRAGRGGGGEYCEEKK